MHIWSGVWDRKFLLSNSYKQLRNKRKIIGFSYTKHIYGKQAPDTALKNGIFKVKHVEFH